MQRAEPRVEVGLAVGPVAAQLSRDLGLELLGAAVAAAPLLEQAVLDGARHLVHELFIDAVFEQLVAVLELPQRLLFQVLHLRFHVLELLGDESLLLGCAGFGGLHAVGDERVELLLAAFELVLGSFCLEAGGDLLF